MLANKDQSYSSLYVQLTVRDNPRKHYRNKVDFFSMGEAQFNGRQRRGQFQTGSPGCP